MATNSGKWYVGNQEVTAAYNKGEQVYPLGGGPDPGTDPKVNESYFSTFLNDKFVQVLGQQCLYKHVNGVTFFTRISGGYALPTSAGEWTSPQPAGAYDYTFGYSPDASVYGLPYIRINPENIPDYIFDCMNYPTEWTQNDSDGKARYPYGGYHTLYIPKPDRRSTVADVRNVFYTTKELMGQAPNPPADLPDQIYFIEIDNQDAYDFTAWNGEILTKPETVTLLVGVSGNNLVEPDDYSNPTKIWMDMVGYPTHSNSSFRQHVGTNHIYMRTTNMPNNPTLNPAPTEDRWYRLEFDGTVTDTVGLSNSDPNLVSKVFSVTTGYNQNDIDMVNAMNSGELRPTLQGPESNYHQAEWRTATYTGSWSSSPRRNVIDIPEYQHRVLVEHKLKTYSNLSQCYILPDTLVTGKWRAWTWED